MDMVTRETLTTLIDAPAEPCVSIFLPTHRAAPNVRSFAKADLIRWKNLMREARDRLEAQGLSARDAEQMLEPAAALVDQPEFWRYQSDGLAAYAAPGYFQTYRVPVRLDELVVVGRRFHVRPLVPLLTGDGQFYVLALSQNAVRLVEGTRDGASAIDPASAPRSLQDALRLDDPEQRLQFHTATPATAGGGRRAAVYHGQGGGADDEDARILQFCRQVNAGVSEVLREGAAPLVLAAVDSLAATYREANTYPHLAEAIVPGNAEALSDQELHARAWPIVEPLLKRGQEQAAARYRELADTDQATDRLETAVRAALDGRVDVLFLPRGVQRWGRFDRATRQVALHEARGTGDEDLLNLAAVHTIVNRGAVYSVPAEDIPGGSIVAAVLRY